MNVLESCSISSPYGKTEECAKFTIDTPSSLFTFSGIATVGRKYTLSLWAKTDTDGSLTSSGATFPVTTKWSRHRVTFTAESEDVLLGFGTEGTYYLYHTQLETGNKATDWTPAPEDVDSDIDDAQSSADQANNAVNATNERVTTAESLIQQLSNCISMLVTDANGESLMTQTENGWTFSMKETTEAVSSLAGLVDSLQKETGSTKATVDALNQAVNDHGATLEYVNVSTFEDEPCIELGESDSDFKLLITNTRIMFQHGSNVPTLINTNGLVTQNIEVKGELIQGGYVQLNTSDGGWGLLWKGVSS